MSRRKNDLSQRLEAVIKTLVPQQEQNPDDLGPMMRAIKAVHSISDHTSTTPEDLERQRAAEELFARLVTPSGSAWSTAMTAATPFCTATAAATPAASWGTPAFWPASWRWLPGLTCSRLSTALRRSTRSLRPLRMPWRCGII